MSSKQQSPGPSFYDQQQSSAGGCGMVVLLFALGMLFAASLLFFIVLRLRAQNWPPPGVPQLPALFWLSTGLLIASSITIQGALTAARGDRRRNVGPYLVATFILGLLFLGNQVLCWLPLINASVTQQTNLFMLAFLMLAVLHALHVIGGLIPMGVEISAAVAGRYGADSFAPVRHLATYWHFLDVVWLTIFVTLLMAF